MVVRRAFRCSAAQLTSDDDAALELEAEQPSRMAQQVRDTTEREREILLRFGAEKKQSSWQICAAAKPKVMRLFTRPL